MGYSVEPPLTYLLPPTTLAAEPLHYDWAGFSNAIIFAANDTLEFLMQWYTKALPDYEINCNPELEDGSLNVLFSRITQDADSIMGELSICDRFIGESILSLESWIACSRVIEMGDEYQSRVVGFATLDDLQRIENKSG